MPSTRSSSDPQSERRPLDLLTTAHRVGLQAWLSARLFEVVGNWVASVEDPGAKLWLGQQTYHFAWHAELWRDRLPELREFAKDEFVVPTPGASAAVDALGGLTGVVERLAGLERALVPRLVGLCEQMSDSTAGVADLPLQRALHLVRRDLVDDWLQGELVLQGLVLSGDAASRAAAASQAVEAAIATAGGLLASL